MSDINSTNFGFYKQPNFPFLHAKVSETVSCPAESSFNKGLISYGCQFVLNNRDGRLLIKLLDDIHERYLKEGEQLLSKYKEELKLLIENFQVPTAKSFHYKEIFTVNDGYLFLTPQSQIKELNLIAGDVIILDDLSEYRVVNIQQGKSSAELAAVIVARN